MGGRRDSRERQRSRAGLVETGGTSPEDVKSPGAPPVTRRAPPVTRRVSPGKSPRARPVTSLLHVTSPDLARRLLHDTQALAVPCKLQRTGMILSVFSPQQFLSSCFSAHSC